MKIFGIIVKIAVALAAVAGAVYLAATYGEKIVAWAKKTLACCKPCEEAEVVEGSAEPTAEEAAEEAPAEEAAEEPAAEEAAEEAPAAETEVVANETDFAE